MTCAWCGHLRRVQERWSLPRAIPVRWDSAPVACGLRVPATRMADGACTRVQLKLVQEVLTLLGLADFASWVMHPRLTLNPLCAGFCLLERVFITFRKERAPWWPTK